MNKLEALENYLINLGTYMLLPARQIEYETIVIEQDRKYPSKKHRLNSACSRYGAKFDGRRRSVMERTGFKRRVPIPVSIYFDIYAFSTYAIKDDDCVWVFGNHVHHIERILATKQGAKGKAVIVFQNSLEVELEVCSIRAGEAVGSD
ncbi:MULTISPECIES: competence protein ComK [unclassified Oceanobacillus]|uniref:competence protein ComK n=1 Tax=unclassified Oceanobacillus TaxID=2630292 RepID=UPI00300E489F